MAWTPQQMLQWGRGDEPAESATLATPVWSRSCEDSGERGLEMGKARVMIMNRVFQKC